MWAVHNQLDSSALDGQKITQLVMHGVEIRGRHEASRHTRLIGRDSDPIAAMTKPSDGIDASWQRDPLIDRLDEVLGILVDDTIPIQNHDAIRCP
jgi:hypothetical protein